MYYRFDKNNLLLEVQIQTKSSKNKILGEHNGRLKIAINSPPIDGRANKALIDFLAKELKVPKTKIKIIKGLRNKCKSIAISDASNLKLKIITGS